MIPRLLTKDLSRSKGPRSTILLSLHRRGIPFDTATSFRTGQRYGPEGIRSASVLLRPYHSAFAIDVCGKLSIVD